MPRGRSWCVTRCSANRGMRRFSRNFARSHFALPLFSVALRCSLRQITQAVCKHRAGSLGRGVDMPVPGELTRRPAQSGRGGTARATLNPIVNSIKWLRDVPRLAGTTPGPSTNPVATWPRYSGRRRKTRSVTYLRNEAVQKSNVATWPRRPETPSSSALRTCRVRS
jgi:hypothetical protein